MERAPYRQPKLPRDFPPKEWSAFNYMGTIAQLGYVSDPAKARLLSNLLGAQEMKSPVVSPTVSWSKPVGREGSRWGVRGVGADEWISSVLGDGTGPQRLCTSLACRPLSLEGFRYYMCFSMFSVEAQWGLMRW
jgi:hypothetical protein